MQMVVLEIIITQCGQRGGINRMGIVLGIWIYEIIGIVNELVSRVTDAP